MQGRSPVQRVRTRPGRWLRDRSIVMLAASIARGRFGALRLHRACPGQWRGACGCVRDPLLGCAGGEGRARSAFQATLTGTLPRTVAINGATRLYPHHRRPDQVRQVAGTDDGGSAVRGHDGLCIPAEVPEGALADVMRCLSLVRNVSGLLVTMPHKFELPAGVARRSPTARSASGQWA